jgi:hypothetical protein
VRHDPPDSIAVSNLHSRFVLVQLLRASYCFAFLDVREWLLRHSDWNLAAPFSLSVGQQILLAWLTAFQSGLGMVMAYYLAAAVAVGIGLYQPRDWPPLFGSFIREGYTIRNVWGRCWHQLLRRVFEFANSGVVRLLHVRKGTSASKYLQLYNGFFISALLHHIGALNCPTPIFARYQFYFFMLQPVGITIEDFAICLGKKLGLSDTCEHLADG